MALIASGYRALAYLMLAVFVLPLVTIGAVRYRPRIADAPQPDPKSQEIIMTPASPFR